GSRGCAGLRPAHPWLTTVAVPGLRGLAACLAAAERRPLVARGDTRHQARGTAGSGRAEAFHAAPQGRPYGDNASLSSAPVYPVRSWNDASAISFLSPFQGWDVA